MAPVNWTDHDAADDDINTKITSQTADASITKTAISDAFKSAIDVLFAVKHNLTATGAGIVPGASDDFPLGGYSVGSIWINVDDDKAWICVDSSSGAAQWHQIDSAGGGGGLANVVDDETPSLGGDLNVNAKKIVGTDVWLDSTSASGKIIVQLGTDDATTEFTLRNETGIDKFSVDALGNITTVGTVAGRIISTDGIKLDGIEASADVTDAANVDLAGAVMTADTSLAGYGFLLTPDGSGATWTDNTKIVDSLSIKTYIDTSTAGARTWKGGYDAATNTPDLDVSPSGISLGDTYNVTVDGNFFATAVVVGDELVADQDDPVDVGDWTIVPNTLSDAAIKTAYENNADTNALTDAEKTLLGTIETNADVTDTTNVTAAGALMDSEVTSLASIKALTLDSLVTTIDGAWGSILDQGTGNNIRNALGLVIGTDVLANVIEDTSPVLGASLDVGAFEITSAGANHIDLHSAKDIYLELGDAAGVQKVRVKDSGTADVVTIDSDGLVTAVHLAGAVTDGALTFRNVADTFEGVFTNTNTANRTYTLQDADGTVAFLTDVVGITDVVLDTTPTLGGNLDLGGFAITTTGDIAINAPEDVLIDLVDSYKVQVRDDANAPVATIDHTGAITATSITAPGSLIAFPKETRAALEAIPLADVAVGQVYQNLDKVGGDYAPTAASIATPLNPPATFRNTVSDRFGLDVITNAGILLERRLPNGVVQPHMFGASTIEDDDTDQHTYFDRMVSLAAADAPVKEFGLSFVVPRGFWRIDQTLEVFEIKAHWYMEGVLRAPYDVTPFPIIRYKGLARDPTGGLDETSRHMNRFSAFREIKPSGVAVWEDDIVLQDGWDPVDRENWAKHADIAVEVTKMISEDFEVGYAGGCMIGFGIRAREDDLDSGATQGSKVHIKTVRANRVDCLLATHSTSAGVWVAGIEIDFGDRIGAGAETDPIQKSTHTFMSTASGAPVLGPNTITLTGGIKDNFKKQNSTPGAPRASAILIDRGGSITHIGDIRIEDNTGNLESAPIEFPNTTPGESIGNVFNFIRTTDVGPIRHNQLFNRVNIREARTPDYSSEKVVAKFNVRDCYWGDSSKVYLPQPWVRVYYQFKTSFPYLFCDGGIGQDAQGLEPVQYPTYLEHGFNSRQLMGVLFDVVGTPEPWNKITVQTDGDLVVPYFAAENSSGVNLDSTLSNTGADRWCGLHHITGDGGQWAVGYDYRYLGAVGTAREQSFTLNTDSPIARIFIAFSGTQAQLADITILSENVVLKPHYPLPPRSGTYMSTTPEKGYWQLGQTIETDTAVERCSTAGFAVAGDWVTSTAVSERDWLNYAGNIYQAATTGTTGATAPVHVSGTVSDDNIDFLFVGTGAKAVFS